MKYALSLFVSLLLVTAAMAEPSTPKISQLFAFTCNHNFSSCPDGFDPALGPIQLSNGSLYGTIWWAGQGASTNGGTVWSVTTSGKAAVLHTFAASSGGQFPNGENPVIGFAEGSEGSLYGVTEQGGTNNAGIFYKVTPGGGFKVLYNFCSLSGCPDGPGAIVLGNDGNFYGAEFHTIFRITPQGVWSLIYALNPTTEGTAGKLIQGSDGNFYGAGSVDELNGTVFRVTPSGDFTIIYTFPDFVGVISNLVQASNTNFYGGTQSTIFQLTPSGEFTTIANLTQAEGPTPTFLMQASDGNLWGLDASGGISPERPGTLFAFSTSGTLITTTEFKCPQGCDPESMIQGSDGNFYGIAIKGGTATGNVLGTVFKIDAGLAPPRR
jgi:uncharacterized repeat protein (TIGR03803 family)